MAQHRRHEFETVEKWKNVWKEAEIMTHRGKTGRGTQREDVFTENSVSHRTKISGEQQHGL